MWSLFEKIQMDSNKQQTSYFTEAAQEYGSLTLYMYM